jgi:outer membrane protein assembly factor BamB
MLRRIVLLALALALTPGCTTVKGWFGGKKDKPDQPTELTKLAAPIAVTRLWEINAGDGEGRLWLRLRPTIDGNRLYTVDDEGRVLAIDAATGKKLWTAAVVDVKDKRGKWSFWRRAAVEAGLTGGPGAGNGLVVVGGRNGEVVALDASTGEKRWSTKVSSEVLSTPLVLTDRVVVRSNDGRVFGFDATYGTRKWVFDRGLPALSVRGNASPVAGSNDLVYIGYDDGSLVALRAQDGLQAWEQVVAQPDGRTELDRMADIDGEIQVGPDEVYAVSYHNQVAAMSASNGRPLWSHEVGSWTGVALSGDKVLLTDKLGNLWALDRSTGDSLWKQDKLLRRQLTTPVIQGDYGVVGDFEGYLHWFKLDTGDLVGRAKIEKAALRGTPQVSADGVLYALTNEGKLAAYKLGK